MAVNFLILGKPFSIIGLVHDDLTLTMLGLINNFKTNMKRFYACLLASAVLHLAVLVPLQLLARHGTAPVPSVIKVALVEKPSATNGQLESKENAPEDTVINESGLETELVESAAKEEPKNLPDDEVSYEDGAKVDPSYHGKLKARIFSMYSYPEEAVYKGIQGTVVISFTIEPTGKTSSLIVKKSSGYKILDNASMMAVRNASPFQPLDSSLNINATFRYVID
jgi:protein TonB